MTTGKRYLFFHRAFNDIDNIAPAIHFLLCAESESEVDILIYSDSYDYRHDHNLAFLQRTHRERVTVTWLGTLLGIDAGLHFGSRLAKLGFKVAGRLFPRRSVPRIAAQKGVNEDAVDKTLRPWLEGGDRAVLAVFDQNRSHAVRGLVGVLRRAGIRHVVTLPVSPWSNVSTLRSVDMLQMDGDLIAKKHDYSVFDRVAVVDHFYLQSLERFYSCMGMESPLAHLAEPLGSLRYCSEWLAIREQEHLYAELPAADDHITTIVLFLSDPATNAFWDEVLRTIRFIASVKGYRLIIKPHTRHAPPHLPSAKRIVVDTTSSSSALIDQAEIVLFWGSSVALEGYIKGKFMACLDYLNGNLSVYRIFNAGFIMQHRDDLHLLLSCFRHNPEKIPYDAVGASRMIHAVVERGEKRPVPERYIEFIRRYAS